MKIKIRKFEQSDRKEAAAIWNQVVEEGVAFPQVEFLDDKTGEAFFLSQSYTGIAADENSGE